MTLDDAWIHNMTAEFWYAKLAINRKEQIVQMLENILTRNLPGWGQPWVTPQDIE